MRAGAAVETILYVDPETIDDQQTHDLLWAELATQLKLAGDAQPPRAELQYEVVMERGYYHSLPGLLAGIKLDVHAPIQGRDIASIDEEHRRFSLREYERIIDLAHLLGANALVLHLTPHDIPWRNGFSQTMRMNQLQIALSSFEELAAYRDRNAPGVLLVPEGLEYPKWWADTREALSVLLLLKRMDPQVAVCVDVAHLWHNRILHPSTITVDDFARELETHLYAVDAVAPVEKIHIAGAYVWRRDDGQIVHDTHAVPGLAPWDRLDQMTRLYLNAPPAGFHGQWLALEPVLGVIAAFGNSRRRLPLLTTEVHVKTMEQKVQVNEIVRKLLTAKLYE